MKKYAYLLLAGCLSFAACRSKSDQVRDFIPGSYVNSAKSEYSTANDTLVIAPDQASENVYSITRKTGYQLLREGKPGPMLHKTKRWTATWNRDGQVLTILQTGKQIRFLPDQHGLVNGNSQYRKL